ncbi:hypothetical protein [Streptomyces flaveus]
MFPVGDGYSQLAELLSLCGPEGYVRERIEACRAAEVTQLNIRVIP